MSGPMPIIHIKSENFDSVVGGLLTQAFAENKKVYFEGFSEGLHEGFRAFYGDGTYTEYRIHRPVEYHEKLFVDHMQGATSVKLLYGAANVSDEYIQEIISVSKTLLDARKVARLK